MILHGPKHMQDAVGVSVVFALALAIAVKVVMPGETAAGIETTQIRFQNGLSAQPDLSWLVSPDSHPQISNKCEAAHKVDWPIGARLTGNIPKRSLSCAGHSQLQPSPF